MKMNNEVVFRKIEFIIYDTWGLLIYNNEDIKKISWCNEEGGIKRVLFEAYHKGFDMILHSGLGVFDGIEMKDNGRYLLSQYTGFVDSSDKKIYEWQYVKIIEEDCFDIGRVEFIEGEWSIHFRYDDEEFHYESLRFMCRNEYFIVEVLGFVY